MQMVNITIWCRRSAPEYTSRQDIVASALLELNWLSKMCQIPHRTACLTQLTAVALNAVRKIARHSHSALQNGRRNSAQGRTPRDRTDTWASVGSREELLTNADGSTDRRLSASYIRSCCKKYPFRLYNQISELS